MTNKTPHDDGPENGNEKPRDTSHDKRRVVVEFDRTERAAATAASAQESGNPQTSESGAPEQQAPASAIQEQLVRLQSEKDDLVRTMVQRQADFENYRKRIERERQEESRRGVGRLIEELIPVLDAFDRALKAHDSPDYEEHRRGLELIYRQLWDSLSKHGLERIAAEGQVFDPHFHQAIERVETTDHPDGAIMEVFQDGYLYHGRVLRPSIVRVAVH